MMSAVVFENVTKSYYLSKGKYGLLTEAFANLVLLKSKKSQVENQVRALKKVSFNVKKGESLGIIGKNGAGKSTILKLISKITFPDSGKITTIGRIGAFIELGAGLHPELTGRENIYLYGAILGMRKKEIDEKFDEIVKFAEIRKFLNMPIKKYSSGMYSRLGFSVVAHCDPDILLVDEVLAVGDISFQSKCLEKMQNFAKEKTIVFVSHNLDAVAKICRKVIYIKNGRIIKVGKPNNVISLYLKSQGG